MPCVAKHVNTLGFVCKEEAAFGVAETLSTSVDPVQPWFTDRSGIPTALTYLYDGAVGPAPGNDGFLRRAVPFGGALSFDMPFFFKGSGAAYSASVFANMHKLWKACGLTAAFSGGAGSEQWLFSPTAVGTTPTSLTCNLYTDELLIPVIGCLGNWKFSGDTSGLIKHTFSLSGTKGAITNSAASVPAGFTYPLAAVVPTSPVGSTLLIGSYVSAIGVKSVEFGLGRKVEPRAGLDAADGHLGFVHRGREPRLTVVVEETALVNTPFHTSAGLDPWELFESGGTFACSFQHAGAQYFKWKLALTQAQMVAVPERTNLNGAACVKLDIMPYVTTPVANDDLTLLVN